ncbi:MAG: hypothetical protein MZW92_20475 [Comamonadaceae bacterium]|nr:hypothetical protein [Comamonadaceae bacterium]
MNSIVAPGGPRAVVPRRRPRHRRDLRPAAATRSRQRRGTSADAPMSQPARPALGHGGRRDRRHAQRQHA